MTKWILLFLSAGLLCAADSKTDVLAAMDAWKQAMMKRDGAALAKIYHSDISYSHSSGMNETKAQQIEATTKGKGRYEAIEFSDLNVRVFGNTALVKGVVDITNNTEGKKNKSHLNILHVWVKGSQGWQMVARQATRLTQ